MAAKRKPAEKMLSEVLRPDVDVIFAKPGKAWDVGERDPGVRADELAAGLDGAEPERRLQALQSMARTGPAAVRHPDLLPRLLRALLDEDADVRREAGSLGNTYLHERNRVYEWLYEPDQEIRWLAVASRQVGRANARDAWQEFAYNTRVTEQGPRFYFYSFPNVIASYDPGHPSAKPFRNYYIHCFDAFCRKNHRRLRGDLLL